VGVLVVCCQVGRVQNVNGGRKQARVEHQALNAMNEAEVCPDGPAAWP
jgi:hypothetical protein